MNITIIGIDLAKLVFQVHAVNEMRTVRWSSIYNSSVIKWLNILSI